MMQKWLLAVLTVLFSVPGVRAQSAGQPNEGLTIAAGTTSETFCLSWWGKGDRTYFIKQSSDLSTWSYFPVIESGTEWPIMYGFTTSAPNLFLKLEGTDQPTTDPDNTDFAGDGMTALWKIRVGLDPLVWVDPNGDLNGDGISNYNEFLANTNALKPAPAIILTAPSGASLVP